VSSILSFGAGEDKMEIWWAKLRIMINIWSTMIYYFVERLAMVRDFIELG
jgi:hypothetical protein